MTAESGPVRYTAEEYSAIGEGERDELIRGVRIARETVMPDHGRAVVAIAYAMRRYLATQPLGAVFVQSGYILERATDTVRGPDASFVRNERLPRDLTQWFEGAPDIAVEVLSPSNQPAAMADTVRQFLHAGTRLVWVLDTRRRTVTVHGADAVPYGLGESEMLDGGDVLPGFRVPVGKLFGWPDWLAVID